MSERESRYGKCGGGGGKRIVSGVVVVSVVMVENSGSCGVIESVGVV